MNYDTYTIVKNARLAIERAEEITKISKIKINKKKSKEYESQIIDHTIWSTIEDINCKLDYIINKLNSIKSI
jgi:hypothetical protein